MNKINRKIDKNGLELSYIVIFKNIKGIYLRIKDGILVVTARYDATFDFLDDFVYNNYEELKKRSLEIENLDYQGNEEYVRYFGKLYPLVVNRGVDNVYFDNALYVFSNQSTKIIKLINEFYYQETALIIQKLFKDNYQLFNRYHIIPKSISYKKMKGKWGYCKISTKEIVLNISISKLDEVFAYYVLCHELCHIKYPNHGKNFHRLLEILCPNHLIIRKLADKKKL